MKKIISLTSYPKRIHSVDKVIECLFKQTIRVDEIILFLSVLEFPNKENDLPPKLVDISGLNGFKIEWVGDNLKSHKKYFYVLQERKDAVVITVDDDVVYSKTMVSDLLKSYEKFPYAVSARRTRIILKGSEGLEAYNQWDGRVEEYADVPRMDLCAIGVGGVLYPPGCASSDWFEVEKIRELAENQDDLWLKYNEIKAGIPIVYVKSSECDINLVDDMEEALSASNMYGGANDRCINNLMVNMKNVYQDIYEQWRNELLTREQHINNKKAYHVLKVRNVLSKVRDIPVYLFGAGKKAEKILKFLDDCKLYNEIKAVIVSDCRNNPPTFHGFAVVQADRLDYDRKVYVICGVGKVYKEEMQAALHSNCIILDLEIDSMLSYY